MALTMWYRGVRFIKDFMVQYLNYIFTASSKNAILFTDGNKNIQFSRTPIAVKRASWDYRNLPAVLVGKATGGLEYVSFTRDLLTTSRSGETEQSYKYGGNIDIYLQFSVRSTTMEERDNLVDITGIYLSHPAAKDFFMRHDLKVPEAPKLNSESEIHEPGIDYPIYATDMTMRFVSRWEEYSVITDRLEDLLVDFDLEVQVTVDTGRTVLDTD